MYGVVSLDLKLMLHCLHFLLNSNILQPINSARILVVYKYIILFGMCNFEDLTTAFSVKTEILTIHSRLQLLQFGKL